MEAWRRRYGYSNREEDSSPPDWVTSEEGENDDWTMSEYEK
jgi:hypothetical protein